MVSVDILDCEAGAKRGGGGVGEGEKRKTLSPQSPSLFSPYFLPISTSATQAMHMLSLETFIFEGDPDNYIGEI